MGLWEEGSIKYSDFMKMSNYRFRHKLINVEFLVQKVENIE